MDDLWTQFRCVSDRCLIQPGATSPAVREWSRRNARRLGFSRQRSPRVRPLGHTSDLNRHDRTPDPTTRPEHDRSSERQCRHDRHRRPCRRRCHHERHSHRRPGVAGDERRLPRLVGRGDADDARGHPVRQAPPDRHAGLLGRGDARVPCTRSARCSSPSVWCPTSGSITPTRTSGGAGRASCTGRAASSNHNRSEGGTRSRSSTRRSATSSSSSSTSTSSGC